MKTRRYFIKQLTPAEVGNAGIKEYYVRCPNDFDYKEFFQQDAIANGSVLEINFKANDLSIGTDASKVYNMRFVFYVNNANKEKRIPSLKSLYKEKNIQANDIVKFESITDGDKTTINMYFYKPTDFRLSASQFVYTEVVSENIPDYDASRYSEYMNRLRKHYNLVLTGAPGTGKTYMAKQIAATMIGNCSWEQLSDEQRKRCEFVQFHPSYDYTDFVEGLRPNKKGDGFKRTDGVFKAFCKQAISQLNDVDQQLSSVYDTLLNESKEGKWTYNSDNKEIKNIDGSFKVWDKEKDSVDTKHAFSKTLIILVVRALLDNPQSINVKCTKDAIKMIYGSEIDRYAVPVIKEICLRYESYYPIHVFIIDEINRGEISKIFGELFYSIDPGYRGEKGRVNSQYQNMVESDDLFIDGFYVPSNVFIIGTMNDIDRSVESMDFAIRRRFAWKEVTAQESAENMNISGLAKVKMEALNKAIIKNNLSDAFCIGAAYFRLVEDNDFDSLWEYHLKGIIFEYFRGEPDANQKIADIEKAYKEAEIESEDIQDE